MKSKKASEALPPFEELYAAMEEYCGGDIPWEGPVPTLEETNYLAAENPSDDDMKKKRKKQPSRKHDKEKGPKQEPFTVSGSVVPRDQLIAELKAQFPGISDEELEAYGA